MSSVFIYILGGFSIVCDCFVFVSFNSVRRLPAILENND